MRRLLLSAIVSIPFALPLVLAACTKSTGETPFDNLQDCVTDHVNGDEGLTPPEAIVTCCLDHPIAGHTVVCKDTVGDCVAFVDAELDTTTSAADIQAGCTDYIHQKDL